MGKNYVENSLKRFLKRKVKITMGFVVAFMITGSLGFAEDINYSEKYYGNGTLAISYLVSANKIGGKPIKKVIGGTNTGKVIINTKNIEKNADAKGIFANPGGDLTVFGKEIYVSCINEYKDKKSRAIEFGTAEGYKNSNLILGNENTEIIEIKSNSNTESIGIILTGGENRNNSYMNITSKLLKIDAKSKSGDATGIHVANYTSEKERPKDSSLLEINSDKTIIDSENTGIAVYSNGNLKINGDLEVNAKTAISSRGYSLIRINENNSKTVKLNGDIEFNYDKDSSDTPIESDVLINLSNKDSILVGKIVKSGNPPIEKNEVTGMKLGLSNGGTWENTGDSFVNELTLNNGVIDNKYVDSDIKVDKLFGNGGVVNMAVTIDEATGKATSGELNIGTVENKNARFAVNYKGTDNLEVDKDKAETVFKELAENIKVKDGKFNADAKLEEGFVSSEYVSELTKDENGNIVVKEDSVKVGNLNSMVEGMRDLATINLLTWRQEINSLNKRMGELRNSTGEHGVWSRVYTGKIENGSKYDNDYQTYQVGYDKKYTVDNGIMFVGGLVSYTDGETDYALGHGENYSVGAGIYATWLNNDGQFADVVLKQSRLHNKFDVRSKDLDKSQSGDYNNWGTSLSGQYGRRFDLNDKFFVEPSVELTLGRVDDTTYTTSAGVDVHQDTMYSLVGNVGTSVGYKFSDKGNVYARAALVKEFQGDIDTEYEKDGALERTSEDLGDTWAEFGVGVNYRFVENMNVYIDVQKTGEATVDK